MYFDDFTCAVRRNSELLENLLLQLTPSKSRIRLKNSSECVEEDGGLLCAGSAKSRATSNETVRETGSAWHLEHYASHRTSKTSPGTDTTTWNCQQCNPASYFCRGTGRWSTILTTCGYRFCRHHHLSPVMGTGTVEPKILTQIAAAH